MGKGVEGFENLSKSELKLADHYAETGNTAGLRQMLEKSAKRAGRSPDRRQMLNPIRLEKE
jgi:hypothetical protein